MHPTLSIEALRKLAELNMDEKCYSVYLHLIEPNIESMLKNYLRGWQDLETSVTMITMRSKGAYKTRLDTILSKGDDPKKYAKDIEISIYEKVNKMKFGQKIDYLHEKGIFGDSVYALLNFLRERRNKIHGYESAFSELEREAFSLTASIIEWIRILNLPYLGFNQEQAKRMLHSSENQSLYLLNKLKEKLSS